MAGRSFAEVAGSSSGRSRSSNPEFPSHFHDDVLTGSGLLKATSQKEGKPAIFFDDDQIESLIQPFKFALIGKFHFARPHPNSIQNWVDSLKIKGECDTAILDGRHILIRLFNEEDYIYIFTSSSFKINGRQMSVLKWSDDYDTSKESPIAPVWLNLPGLKPHLFDKEVLFSIANAFGKPLKMDTPTQKLLRPSAARILIERDVTSYMQNEIWIGTEQRGYWQRAELEKVPLYCTHCQMFGHHINNCFHAHPSLRRQMQQRTAGNGTRIGLNHSIQTPHAESQIGHPEHIPASHQATPNEKGDDPFLHNSHLDQETQLLVHPDVVDQLCSPARIGTPPQPPTSEQQEMENDSDDSERPDKLITPHKDALTEASIAAQDELDGFTIKKGRQKGKQLRSPNQRVTRSSFKQLWIDDTGATYSPGRAPAPSRSKSLHYE